MPCSLLLILHVTRFEKRVFPIGTPPWEGASGRQEPQPRQRQDRQTRMSSNRWRSPTNWNGKLPSTSQCSFLFQFELLLNSCSCMMMVMMVMMMMMMMMMMITSMFDVPYSMFPAHHHSHPHNPHHPHPHPHLVRFDANFQTIFGDFPQFSWILGAGHRWVGCPPCGPGRGARRLTDPGGECGGPLEGGGGKRLIEQRTGDLSIYKPCNVGNRVKKCHKPPM